ncbi:TetR family transcriptional regulator [Nocardia sp. NPDC052254]|uniref:TetR/AcrR family transcriptional regulator n=1 Tax=Nocardia sp. NPDC052254 TaxID=3155681 RepID=UPI00341A03E8
MPIAAHQAPDDADPRRQRSRARLLAAAGELLATGGIDAVTVEAVTQLSRVARTTLYRHFRGVAQLRAAALQRLLMPPCDPAAARGSLRDRLIELVARQALSIDDAPLHTTTLAWLATAGHTEVDAGPEAATLRHRLTEEYLRPFEELLTGTEAVAELGVCDIRTAVAQLIGPIVFTRIAGSGRSTGEDCVRLVDDFLAARTARHTGSTGGTTSGK